MNKIIFRVLLMSVLFLSPNILIGQNDPKLSIFNFNPLFYNPAYAGSSDGLNIVGMYATQWVGFEGAPKTQFLTIHTKNENRPIGYGIDFSNDQAGVTREYNIEGNFAYYLNLNQKYNLAFGLKAGLNSNSVDLDLLKRLNPEEEIFGSEKLRNDTPTVGVGFNFYSNRLFVGLSAPNVLGVKYYNPNYSYITAKKRNYYYLTAGYKINLDYEFTLTPSILVRETQGAPISALTSLNFNWREKYLTGLNFDYNSSIGAYFAANVLENFKVGYSYDLSIKKFSNYNGGNHTLFLTYTLYNQNSGEKCSCKLF
ncbi:type IX secretion system membrane protein, PorP/SprF family [Flavobacterium swingsii]|jgi:type IX secretion system PorP/SprF family membrane protein|uniref:Type IX secretion system membrane protein, PorP/SprF family n=1 Tax=Flavobacterium swingsii TaxID=498292 RepID=A0A1I0ZPL9_9FLAO|nr:type IX secretion system membrane protein PorP/SprF [Flavobacterium swingsii]SFB27066.1 type IX secretion system membrane protein, PorP/SprF family [Flavobacterium swingsii]